MIRGQVIDIGSQAPLAFSTITVMTTGLSLGTIADDNGFFRFEKVPVGRHALVGSGRSEDGRNWAIFVTPHLEKIGAKGGAK